VGLTRRFGSLTAVDQLSIEVEAGEVFGLIGSNGAGRSVTIKMLRTLLPPNPVDALPALMIPGGASAFGLGVDVSVLLGALVALVWTAARLYPRMVT